MRPPCGQQHQGNNKMANEEKLPPKYQEWVDARNRYQILDEIKAVKIIRMWTHYG